MRRIGAAALGLILIGIPVYAGQGRGNSSGRDNDRHQRAEEKHERKAEKRARKARDHFNNDDHGSCGATLPARAARRCGEKCTGATFRRGLSNNSGAVGTSRQDCGERSWRSRWTMRTGSLPCLRVCGVDTLVDAQLSTTQEAGLSLTFLSHSDGTGRSDSGRPLSTG